MLKKAQRCITVIIIILLLVVSYNPKVIAGNLQLFNEHPIKVGVFLASFDEPYVAAIKSCMEEVEKESEGKVKYYFFDGKRNQAIQDKDIDELLEKNEVQLILLNLVNQGEAKHAISRIKEYNIPVIFFGGTDINIIKAYNKAYWVGTDPAEGGVLQGKVIAKLWKDNKEIIDKNKDDIMQYVILKGPDNDVYAIERTKNSIVAINRAGVKTQELASIQCKWSEEEAKNAIESSLLKFGNNIEMIVANNDSMAIGAIKALQERGYNLGDEKMTIPVVGFDGIEEALELIKKGTMEATIIQEPHEFAKAFYIVGMNLVNNRKATDGTEYKVNDNGISIVFPYKSIMTSIN